MEPPIVLRILQTYVLTLPTLVHTDPLQLVRFGASIHSFVLSTLNVFIVQP